MNDSNIEAGLSGARDTHDPLSAQLNSYARFRTTTPAPLPKYESTASRLRPTTLLSQTAPARNGTACDTAPSAPEAAAEGACLLFEDVLPVITRLNNHEDVSRPLGLCVRTARGGGPNGNSRTVLVRLTDPHDPFLLFQVELLEEDYGALKQKLELVVDFNGFAGYVVNMLEGVTRGEANLQATFTVQPSSAGSGVLRVVERNAYKTVEHVALTLLREGDAGQKRYLADRFLHFQQAYLHSKAEHAEESAQAELVMEELREGNQRLLDENRRLREELKLSRSESEATMVNRLREMEEAHRTQSNSLREGYEVRLKTEREKADELHRRLLDDVRTKEAANEQLRSRVSQLETEDAAVKSKLRIAEDQLRLQMDELVQLRSAVEELSAFRSQAAKAMSENELNYVSITERLRGALSALKTREEELTALREQYDKQDGYIRILSTQNEQLSVDKQAADANLAKAHHIISSQLQTIKTAKERYSIAAEQLRGQQALASERELSVQRLKDELAAATEQTQNLQRKNSALREQLQQTDNAREKLAEELKNSQTALLHLQRSTSVNGRHWGVFAPRSNSYTANLTSTGGVSREYEQHTTYYDPKRQTTYADGTANRASSPNQGTPSLSPSPTQDGVFSQGMQEPGKDVKPNVDKSSQKTSLSRSSGGPTTATSPAPSAQRTSVSPPQRAPESQHLATKSFFPPATDAEPAKLASAYF